MFSQSTHRRDRAAHVAGAARWGLDLHRGRPGAATLASPTNRET